MGGQGASNGTEGGCGRGGGPCNHPAHSDGPKRLVAPAHWTRARRPWAARAPQPAPHRPLRPHLVEGLKHDAGQLVGRGGGHERAAACWGSAWGRPGGSWRVGAGEGMGRRRVGRSGTGIGGRRPGLVADGSQACAERARRPGGRQGAGGGECSNRPDPGHAPDPGAGGGGGAGGECHGRERGGGRGGRARVGGFGARGRARAPGPPELGRPHSRPLAAEPTHWVPAGVAQGHDLLQTPANPTPLPALELTHQRRPTRVPPLPPPPPPPPPPPSPLPAAPPPLLPPPPPAGPRPPVA